MLLFQNARQTLRTSVPSRAAKLPSRTLSQLADDSAFRIPLIDFAKFRAAKSQAEKEETANQVVDGFKEVGFIYLNVSFCLSMRLQCQH